MNNVNTIRLLNEQITHEISSAYLYLSMSMFCEGQNLKGCAKWLKLQSIEEQGHGDRIIGFLHDLGATPTLMAIEQPRSEWGALKELFAQVLSHEKKVTSLIWAIKESAMTEHDHATLNFIEWFVKEQVEEEATAQYILDKLSNIDGNKIGEMMIDNELGARSE